MIDDRNIDQLKLVDLHLSSVYGLPVLTFHKENLNKI